MKKLLASAALMLSLAGGYAKADPPGTGTWYIYWVDKSFLRFYIDVASYRVKGNRVGMETYIERPNAGGTYMQDVFDCGTYPVEVASLDDGDVDTSGKFHPPVDYKTRALPQFKKVDPLSQLNLKYMDRIGVLSTNVCSRLVTGGPIPPADATATFKEFDAVVRKNLDR
jgi:hypothetical protein